VYEASGGRIMGVRFDLGRRAPAGEPVMFVSDVRGRAELAADGTLAYLTGSPLSRVEVVDERGTAVLTLPEQRRLASGLRWSPDGTRLVMRLDNDQGSDLWMYDAETRILSRLTESSDLSGAPAWTRDGRRVGFIRALPGGGRAYWVAVDGSGPPEPIPGTAAITRSVMTLDFMPEGGAVFVHAATTQQGLSESEPQAFAVPLSGGAPAPLLVGTHLPNDPTISPDGRWVASREGGTLVVRSLAARGGRVRVAPGGAEDPRWSRDGRRLFFRGGGAFRAATLDVAGPMPRVVRIDSLFPDVYQRLGGRRGYDVHPDGRRFVVARETGEGRRLVVVTNWLTEVRARLDGKP
jgi:Tol biopolymer transport system component